MHDNLRLTTRRIAAAMAIASPLVAAAMPGAGGPDPAAAPAKPPALEARARLEVPLFDEAFEEIPVARVGDEVITLAELNAALASAHMELDPETARAGRKNPRELLERLIETRLLVAEARAMGLDELPEIAESVQEFEERTRQAMVEEAAIRDVKADALDLERRYREVTVEWKHRSLLFTDATDAAAATAALRAGRPFDEVAKEALEAKKATGGEPAGGYTPVKEMLPQVAGALRGKQAGEVAGPVAVGKGFAVVLVEDSRYGDVPVARAEIEEKMLSEARTEALKGLKEKLKKQHARVDRKLLASVDYHAKQPGIEKLLKDRRPVARIAGEAPVTVGDLTKELLKDVYHGVDRVVREKRLNSRKEVKLDVILVRRLFAKEAARQKIAESAEYRRRVAEFERNVLFGVYLQRVIAPDARTGEEALKAHYEAHRADYTIPAFYRLDALAFADTKDAQLALEKLKAGTDFRFLKVNADRQIPEEKRVLKFTGMLLSATGLPPSLAATLEGAKPGDLRLHATEGQSYVVSVLEVRPAELRPLEDVREELSRSMFGDAIVAGIKEMAGKLRAVHAVQLFLTDLDVK